MKKINQFPHCDPLVLHAPNECKYCDEHSDWQELRDMWGINFTGKHDPSKKKCPAESKRAVEKINLWGGNVPVPEGYTTIMYSPNLIAEDEADVYWKEFEQYFANPIPETKPNWIKLLLGRWLGSKI